jgi:ubiquinone/menaquinone biosynthesis C-methylase UbiE
MKVYVSPRDQSQLVEQENAFVRTDGESFPIIKVGNFIIPNFVNDVNILDQNHISSLYNHDKSVEFYINFKEWLFKTFAENESEFRLRIMKKILNSDDKKVLITGCGLGDDIIPALEITDHKAQVYVTDLSLKMVLHAADVYQEHVNSVHFSVCNACHLPFPDDYFDAVFHFGGINFFEDSELAIQEMMRVVRVSGKVGFGDESVGPWLRHLDYGKIAITNNQLWASNPPIEKIPFQAVDVKVEWLLGNCFYFISFLKTKHGPYMDIDIPHKGYRGGTMRTRYYGGLEGISITLKEHVLSEAQKRNMSVSEFMEKAFQHFLKQ